MGATEFIKCISDFYKDDLASEVESSASEEEDPFLSAKPPKKRIVLDSAYLESLWSWISTNKDVSSHSNNVPPSQQIQGFTQQQHDFIQKYAKTRLVTTDDRIWHAITDHGVDWKRLPKSEFQCLCVIAAHGPGGVLQPDVVNITGQDKRSVPGRTDKLAEKGYIIKESCVGGGSKTSLLRLKKFAQAQNAATSSDSPTVARVQSSNTLIKVIRYENWFDSIVKTLKDRNGVAPIKTIREAAVSSVLLYLCV